ncbi:MAG: succinate dehydrogenase assembly factor 2 family protein [Wenzhouxiangella sp.]|nr:MAG: succinate dehydrogenase assembly factor 2 family protein [Wenzhouxiangella sp.]
MKAVEGIPRDLRWRSRRGMRELDMLLSRWLEQRWPEATSELRTAYPLLLDCEDDDLWDWLLGRSDPESPALQALVRDIRGVNGRAEPD